MASKTFASHLITDELSYNVSRKYPFSRTFKWWVLGAFTLLMLLFTVFNLALNGFDKDFKYTMDPNATAHNSSWYNSPVFTWGSNSLTPTCQSIQIPLGYKFITTNLGLRYTVSRIVFIPGTQPREPRASVSYHNNILEDCDVTRISINLKKSDTSIPQQNQTRFRRYSWMESDALAVAQCNITNAEGTFTLVFQVNYAPTIYDRSFIARDDLKSYPALWWGARLLNAYFAGVQHTMTGWLPDDNAKTLLYTRANIEFDTSPHEANKSIQNPQLYRISYKFLRSTGELNDGYPEEWATKTPYNNKTLELSRPLTEAFMWNQIFRSVILADLGNTHAENLVADKTLLRYALDPGDDFNRVPGGPLNPDNYKYWLWMFAAFPSNDGKIIFLNESLNLFENEAGPLRIERAYIHAEYICSVPVKRSPLAMVMFTLVANLALFHSAWALFKYSADRRVSWMDRESNWCEGCLDMRRALREDEKSLKSEMSQGSEIRQSVDVSEGCGELRETGSSGEDSFEEEDERMEASTNIGGLLRLERSSTQRLIPG